MMLIIPFHMVLGMVLIILLIVAVMHFLTGTTCTSHMVLMLLIMVSITLTTRTSTIMMLTDVFIAMLMIPTTLFVISILSIVYSSTLRLYRYNQNHK